MRKTEHLSLRSYLIQVTVEQVLLEIKFPCTILVSLKIGRDEVFSDEEIKPVDNRVTLTQKLQLRCTLVYDSTTKKHTEKKVQLWLRQAAIHVHVNSLTGRNTAGVSKLDLAELVVRPPTQPVRATLERCPARNPEICYRLAVKFEGQLPYQELSLDGGSHDAKQSDGGSRGDHSRVRQAIEYPKDEQPSFGGYLRKSDSRQNKDLKDKDMLSSSSAGRHRILDELELDEPVRKQKLRATATSGFRPNFYPVRETDTLQHEISVPPIPPLAPSTLSRVRTPSAITTNEGMVDAERKIARLEAERQNQVKQISSLNSQIELQKAQLLNRSTRQSQLISEIERLKRRLDTQQVQLQNCKKAKSELERQLSTRLLDQKSNAELQHKLTRTSELEAEVQQLRKAKEQADKSLKQKMKEYNLMLDRVQDLTNSSATNQKRLEMKDTFYKEEVKKYSEKLVESELQKQKLMSELESLRTSVDEKTRKIDAMTRDRDRLLQDQKAKFTKKIDQLKQESEALQTKRNQDHQEIANLNTVVERMQIENTELSLEKVRLAEDIERLRTKLMAEALYKNKYEEELKERSTINQQKSAMEQELELDRRDKEHLIQKLTDELNQRSEEAKQLTQQNVQLQRQLKQREIKLTDHQFQIDSLKKKLEAAKKSEQRKAEQLVELQQSMEGYIKIESSKKHETMSIVQRYEQEMAELTTTVSSLNNQLAEMKTLHQEELEELRIQSKGMVDALEEHSKQLQTEKAALQMQLNHQKTKFAASSDRAERFQLENDNLNNLVFELRNQVQDKMLDIQKLDRELYDRKETIVAINKQMGELADSQSSEAQRNEELSAKVSQLTGELADKQNLLLERTSQLQEEIDQLAADREKYHSRSKDLTATIETLTLDIERLTAELNIKSLDNDVLKSQHDTLKREFERLAEQNDLIKADFRQAMTESEHNSTEAGELNRRLRETQHSYETLSQQSYNLQTSLGDFSRMLNEFIISSETKSVAELQECLNGFKQLPFSLTAVITQLNEMRQRQSHEKNETAIQLTNISNDLAKVQSELYNKEQESLTVQQQLSAKNDELYLTVQNLRQEQVNIENNLMDVTKKLEAAIKEGEIIEMGKQQLKAQLMHTLTELDTTKAYLEHAEAQTTSKEAEIKALNIELTAKLYEFNSLREKGYSEQSGLFRQLQAAKLKMAENEETIRRFEEEIANKDRHLNEQTIRLLGEIETRSAKILQLEGSLASQTTAAEDLGYRLETSARKERQSAQKLLQASAKLLELETLIERQNLSVMALTNSMRDLQLKNHLLEKERESQHKRLNQLGDDVSQYEYMLNTMKSDLQTTQQELDDTTDSLRRRQEEKSVLHEQLNLKNKTMAALNQQISKLKDLVFRINKSAEDKEGEISESSRQTSLRVGALEKELQAITIERNTLKQRLKEQQNLRVALKKITDKEKQQFLEEKNKLDAEVMELNEQIYSISSDVNTMRLREEQDQENMERLQNELNALASMYVAEKKKNEQLEQTRYYSNSDRSDKYENEVRELRSEAIQNIEEIRRLSAENNYLHQQLLDNPAVLSLSEKIEEIKRDYTEELAIMQEIINRERKDAEQMRRQYHQKCIGYQQKIRMLEVQFQNEREREHQLQERLETIEEEKSSTMSEIGAAQNEHTLMTSPDRPIEFGDSDIESLRELIKSKDKDLLALSIKISQLENVIALYESSGELMALQEELKLMVSQKLYFMNRISEILSIVTRIKTHSNEYSDFNQESAEILNDFRLLENKLIEVSEHSIHLQEQHTGPTEANTQSRSTGIVESSSQNSHEFEKVRHGQQSDPTESIAGLANRLKANLSNYRN